MVIQLSFLFSFGPKNLIKLVKFIGVFLTSKVYRCSFYK